MLTNRFHDINKMDIQQGKLFISLFLFEDLISNVATNAMNKIIFVVLLVQMTFFGDAYNYLAKAIFTDSML